MKPEIQFVQRISWYPFVKFHAGDNCFLKKFPPPKKKQPLEVRSTKKEPPNFRMREGGTNTNSGRGFGWAPRDGSTDTWVFMCNKGGSLVFVPVPDRVVGFFPFQITRIYSLEMEGILSPLTITGVLGAHPPSRVHAYETKHV